MRWSKSRSRQSLSSLSWVQLPRGLLDAQERAGTGRSRAHELVPLPGHHLSQPSRGGGPGCPKGPQGPQKRGHWRKTADRKAVSVEGQSHQQPPPTPRSHPLGLPPRLPVFARQLRLGTLLPLTGSHLRSLGGLRAAQRPVNPGGGSSHSPMAERGPSTALWGASGRGYSWCRREDPAVPQDRQPLGL